VDLSKSQVLPLDQPIQQLTNQVLLLLRFELGVIQPEPIIEPSRIFPKPCRVIRTRKRLLDEILIRQRRVSIQPIPCGGLTESIRKKRPRGIRGLELIFSIPRRLLHGDGSIVLHEGTNRVSR
jgi:hypothetical protein